MVKQKSKSVRNLLSLIVIPTIIIICLIIFYVPVQSQQIQCIKAPCPPIQKTIYNLIVEMQKGVIIDYGIDIPEFEDDLTGEIVQPVPIDQAPVPINGTVKEIILKESKQSYVERLLEKLGIDFTSKFGIASTAIIYDTNGKVINENSQILSLSVTDSQGNLLDLATIQFKFDAITQEKANIIAKATIDLAIDSEVIATKELKINGNTLENTIPFEVREGTNIANVFNFTLSDKGNNWSDGSLHELKLTIKNIDAQVSTGSGVTQFAKVEPFTLYLLELKQDESRKTIVDESGIQISVPKNDDTVQITSNSPFQYATSCDNNGCPLASISNYERTSMTVKIKDSDGNLVDELTTPNCSTSLYPDRSTRSTAVQCIETSEIKLNRLTNYTFEINAMIGGGYFNLLQPLIVSDTYEYTTPATQQNLYLTCNVVYSKVQTCGSNIGWVFP